MEMPADYYDINVHPTKMEVRFKDESEIYRVFYHAIKSAILSKDFLGNNEQEEQKKDYVQNEFKFLTSHFERENSAINRIPVVVDNEKSNLKIGEKRTVTLNEENSEKQDEQDLIKRENQRKVN